MTMTTSSRSNSNSWGLIAGNGRFPFLVLEGARSQGIDMAVIALKEEASPNSSNARAASALGKPWRTFSKAIDLMHQEGVTHAVMAGQVKHNKIFSSHSAGLETGETFVLVAAEKIPIL